MNNSQDEKIEAATDDMNSDLLEGVSNETSAVQVRKPRSRTQMYLLITVGFVFVAVIMVVVWHFFAPEEPAITQAEAEEIARIEFDRAWGSNFPNRDAIITTNLVVRSDVQFYKVEIGFYEEDVVCKRYRAYVNAETGIKERYFRLNPVRRDHISYDFGIVISGGRDFPMFESTYMRGTDSNFSLSHAHGHAHEPWDVINLLEPITLSSDFHIQFTATSSGILSGEPRYSWFLVDNWFEEVYGNRTYFSPPSQPGEYVLRINARFGGEFEGNGIYGTFWRKLFLYARIIVE